MMDEVTFSSGCGTVCGTYRTITARNALQLSMVEQGRDANSVKNKHMKKLRSPSERSDSSEEEACRPSRVL